MPARSSGLVSQRTRTHLRPRLGGGHGVGGGEDDLAHGGARGGVQAAGDERRRSAFLSNCGCSSWSSWSAVTRMRASSLVMRPSCSMLDGDAERGGGGALADAGLEHPQLALLDGELDVAHVAVVVLQHVEDVLAARRSRPLPDLDVFEVGDGAACCGCRRRRPRPGRSPGSRRRHSRVAVGGVAGEGTRPWRTCRPCCRTPWYCTLTAVPRSSAIFSCWR